MIEFYHTPSPHFVIRNFLSQDELNAIESEINFLDDKLIDSGLKEATKDNIILRKAKGLFLSKFIKDYNQSPSMKFLVNSFTNPNFNTQIEVSWIRRLYLNIKNMSFLLNKYEEGDYYDKHHDNTIFTAILCLKYECDGGDFFLNEESNIINLNHNDFILFFGCEEHGVHKVNSGTRYSITTFMT
jgi:hypothetical protein